MPLEKIPSQTSDLSRSHMSKLQCRATRLDAAGTEVRDCLFFSQFLTVRKHHARQASSSNQRFIVEDGM